MENQLLQTAPEGLANKHLNLYFLKLLRTSYKALCALYLAIPLLNDEYAESLKKIVTLLELNFTSTWRISWKHFIHSNCIKRVFRMQKRLKKIIKS